MLKHLKAQVSPIAKQANTVCFGEYRITVLDTCLFRLEQDPTLKFNDDATQAVWFRNMPEQKYTVTRTSDGISVSTESNITLSVFRDAEKNEIIINGRALPLENNENLLGTYRTLDCYDGEIYIRDKSRLRLGNGVCSKNGVAVIDDTASLRLIDGRLEPASDDLLDLYVFAYGQDYRAAVRALYMICGSVPMLPRYAFGNWWSRYHAYTADEYLYLMDCFKENGIPFTVATLDVDWHYSRSLDEDKQITAQGKNTLDRGCLATPENKQIGWTGYSWNKRLFPDYRKFLSQLHERGLKVTLNLHPSSGVRYYEDMYEEMANAMGVDPAEEKAIEFNISDPKFTDAYFRILHAPYERDGVDFWWIDWQQGNTSEMKGLDPLWALNHYHYLDNAKDRLHPLIMSRYAGIGSHRYPIGFSGDTTISWDTLRLMPYFTATAANCGYTWWGHDIGGHHLGSKDDELYLRFLQFGVFNPIERMHCTDSALITKEPWAYENGIGELAKKALVLRHRMIPFLYTCNYLTHSRGLALCEPLYYQYPNCRESYEFKNEYIFGQKLIVAPVTSHSTESGLSEVEVWLPEGTWTDFFTGELYRVKKGGKVFTAVRPLDSIPVFVKAGSAIPLSNDGGNSCENPSRLEIKLYNGDGEFSLYEDSDTSEAFTTLLLSGAEDTQGVTVSVSGDTSVIPSDRSLTLSFPNIITHHPAESAFKAKAHTPTVSVLKNGIPCEARLTTYGEVSVTLDTFDASAIYQITVSRKPLDRLEELLRDVIGRLQKMQGAFSVRQKLLKSICAADGASEIWEAVNSSDISDVNKKRLTEVLLIDSDRVQHKTPDTST